MKSTIEFHYFHSSRRDDRNAYVWVTPNLMSRWENSNFDNIHTCRNRPGRFLKAARTILIVQTELAQKNRIGGH